MSNASLKFGILAVGWVVAMFWALPAQAHRLNVFAYAEGDNIVLEAAFNSGRAAQGAVATLTHAASGEVLATGETDAKGACALPIPAKAREGRLDLEVVVDAGGGHRGTWPLAAAEYLGGGADGAPAAEGATQASVPAQAAAPAQAAGAVGLDEAALARVVEAAVEKKIAPMRAMLMESQMAGPGVAEILGGIGWIFGLLGVAAYMRSRRG